MIERTHNKNTRFCYYYLITNKLNGKQYVGRKMFEGNPYLDTKYMGSSKTLKNYYKIYGISNFDKHILAYEEFISKEVLDVRESYFMHIYNTINPNGYNKYDPGKRPGFSIAGTKWTKEQSDKKKEWFKTDAGIKMRQKMSERVSGENSPSKRPEVREKDRIKGRLWAKTEKGKIGIQKMVDACTPEVKKRGAETMKEWYKTEDGQRKIEKCRQDFLGDNHPLKNPEIREKHRQAVRDPEMNKKKGESAKAYFKTEKGVERRKKLSERKRSPESELKRLKSLALFYQSEKGIANKKAASERITNGTIPLNTEESRKKGIEAHRAFYKTPRGLEIIESMKGDNNVAKRPEVRKKISENQRKK